MNWKHGWRLGARREKTEFLLAELVAECLDVVARLSKLAIATRLTITYPTGRFGDACPGPLHSEPAFPSWGLPPVQFQDRPVSRVPYRCVS